MDPRLKQLGLEEATLTPAQRHELNEQGYTILPDLISPAWLQPLRDAFERITVEEGDQAGIEVNRVPGVRRLSDLVNKGEVFDALYLHPLLLAAVWHVLQQPFKLHSLNGHDPLPGHGQQALHPDYGGPRGEYHVVNSMWMLDDVTRDNGATRIIPGSHKRLEQLKDVVDDLEAPHPDEVYLTAPAGSVGVFNSSAWHSCTKNVSKDMSRRMLHCAFITRDLKQQTDQRAYLRPETAARISDLAKYILDVE